MQSEQKIYADYFVYYPPTENLTQKTEEKILELKNDADLLANNGQQLIDFLFGKHPIDLVQNVLRYYSFVTMGETMKARVNRRAREDVRFSEHVRRCLIDASKFDLPLVYNEYFLI